MTSTEGNTRWQPIGDTERYATLDLLRGLALFGVLLVNLLYFFRISLFEHILTFHSHTGWLNHAVDLIVAGLVEFKAFDLFSLTFGIGAAIQAERATLRDVRPELFLLRRFLILLAFGIGHILLVSNVDILSVYAVCGLCLIPLLRLPGAMLTVIGICAIYLPSVLGGWVSLPSESALRAHVADATRVYGSGSFGDILAFRWHETQRFMLPLLIGVAQKTLGMMLLGVALWRTQVIRDPQSYRRLLWPVCLGAGLIGILNTTAEVSAESARQYIYVPPLVTAFGSHVPLAFAYAAALLLWRRSGRPTGLLAAVEAAGRMAFTNYLMQSVIFALLFYGYGLQLFGRLDPKTAAVLGIAVYAAQLWFSKRWLNRFRFGPFEWLWRSLTYGRLPPMRLPPPQTAPAPVGGAV